MSVKLIFLAFILAVCDSYEKWNMQTLCKMKVPVHGGELYFDSDKLPQTTRTCSLTLEAAESRDMLSFFFTTYSVGVDCAHTNVTFIDVKSGQSDSALWPGLKEALCSTDKYMIESQIFSTSGSSITIVFKRNIKTEEGRAHSNFSMKVSSFRPHDIPCDSSDRNGTLYQCENKRCVYRDLLCQNLNPCGNFMDECPSTATEAEPHTSGVVAPILAVVACMIVLFFSCQVFLMIRNGKCPCKYKGYSNELDRQISTASNTFSLNGRIETQRSRETDQFVSA